MTRRIEPQSPVLIIDNCKGEGGEDLMINLLKPIYLNVEV